MDVQSLISTTNAAGPQTITPSPQSITLRRATANDADTIFQAMQTEITKRPASTLLHQFKFNTSEDIKTFINDPIQLTNPLTGIWMITKKDDIVGFYKIYTTLKQIQIGYSMLSSLSTILSPHRDSNVRKEANAKLKEIFKSDYNKPCILNDKTYKILYTGCEIEI